MNGTNSSGKHYDTVVVGSGAAGITLAYSSRFHNCRKLMLASVSLLR